MSLSNPIPVIRLTPPYGKQTPDSIFVGDAEYAAWKKVDAEGMRITVELLQNGDLSMFIEDPKIGDFDCVVSSNIPKLPLKFSKMLLRFDPKKVAQWRTERS